jgi:hypothetical protein
MRQESPIVTKIQWGKAGTLCDKSKKSMLFGEPTRRETCLWRAPALEWPGTPTASKSLHLPQKALKQLRQWWRRLPTSDDSQKEKAEPQEVHSACGYDVGEAGERRLCKISAGDKRKRGGGGEHLELEHANSKP